MSNPKKILYITYDGLTDPLGQSQILPYVIGLSKKGFEFTILSFEKKHRLEKNGEMIRQLTLQNHIRWVPLSFTSKPPLLSKFYDALRMRRKALFLQRQLHFDMVHCRSYIAADVGLLLKKKFGIGFFFDMRGFWADEKKDGGSWNTSNPLFGKIYRYYKQKEKQYIKNADQIISLTYAGKEEMGKWGVAKNLSNIAVIPCCADMDLFSLTDKEQKRRSREIYGIPNEVLVLSYLGSVGTWYMLNEMLVFFKHVKQTYPDSIFFFVTHTDPSVIYEAAEKLKISRTDLFIKEASRKEVPLMVKASDINISFIKPVYSKISSSPTKLGEVLSMGIPVICNSGVGDVEKIVKDNDLGFVIEEFDEPNFKKAIENIDYLKQKDPAEIRASIENIYSLEKGVQLYDSCYNMVLNEDKTTVGHLPIS